MKESYKLKKNDYISAVPALESFARLINRSGLGLREEMNTDIKYKELNIKLLQQQAPVTIYQDNINALNKLTKLSYGLNSLAIGIGVINKHRSWYSTIPEKMLDEKESYEDNIDSMYMKALASVKLMLRKAILKEAKNAV